MVWYSHLFHSLLLYTVKGFDVVNKTEVDVFLELSCFFYDPGDVVYLISASSAFSKIQLEHLEVLSSRTVEPGLENFEHYFASV